MYSYSNYKEIEDILYNYLNIFSSMICGRCFHISHHECTFNNLIDSIKTFDKKYIDNWFNDIEHGFIHGIFVGFIAFYYDQYVLNNKGITNFKEKEWRENIEYINKNIMNYLCSSLLHDFLKCNGYSQNKHDNELINFFPKLLTETYNHSTPKKEEEIKLLIIGDRTELRRYTDYNDWKKEELLEHENLLNIEQKVSLDIFYDIIRPALLYFYENRNETFIRHGLEKVNKMEKEIDENTYFPLINSYSNLEEHKVYYKKKEIPISSDSNKNSYAIEIGNIPFADYFWEEKQNHHGWNCMNHDMNHNWNNIKGIISNKDFKKHNGKIIYSNHRDHLYASSEIIIKDWTFIHKNLAIDKKHQDTQTMKDLYKIIEVKPNERIIEIEKLFKYSNGVISQRVIVSFYKLYELIKAKMYIIN